MVAPLALLHYEILLFHIVGGTVYALLYIIFVDDNLYCIIKCSSSESCFFVFQGNALNFINENLYFLQKKESGVFLFGGGISRIQVD